MDGILSQSLGSPGVLSSWDEWEKEQFPLLHPPRTPAYTPHTVRTPAVSAEPARPRMPNSSLELLQQMYHQQSAVNDIQDERVNPVLQQAYRTLPSVAIQHLSPALESDAKMRQLFIDRMMLGRPSEENYSPGTSAIAGALLGASQTSNALGAIGGALVGYAEEKEAQRKAMDDYKMAQVKMAYDFLKDQRDTALEVGKAGIDAQFRQENLDLERQKFGRDTTNDVVKAYQWDETTADERAKEARRARNEDEKMGWERKDRSMAAQERGALGGYRRNPYLDWDNLSGGSVEMMKEQKKAQSGIYQEANKYYRTQLTGREKLVPQLETLTRLLNPGDAEGKGQGEAYKSLSDSGWGTEAAFFGAKLSPNDPVNAVRSAIQQLGQLSRTQGAGQWTDKDYDQMVEALKGQGARNVMYRQAKEKLDAVRALEQEQRDLDTYHQMTGGGATGFDAYRDDLQSFRSQLPEGSKVDPAKYFEARSWLAEQGIDAQNIRPFVDAEGKVDVNHIMFDDPNKEDDDPVQIARFRWGR